MTAEQTAKNIRHKIDELALDAANRMDALADVASDHDWLDRPASVTAASSTSSARSSSTSSSGNKSAEAKPSPIALACGRPRPLDIPQCLPYGMLARPA